jgi:hypothetical protein
MSLATDHLMVRLHIQLQTYHETLPSKLQVLKLGLLTLAVLRSVLFPKRQLFAGFEVLMAVVMKGSIFWDMTPCTQF